MKVLSKFILIDSIKESSERGSGLLMTAGDTKELRYVKAKVISCGELVNDIPADSIIYYDKASSYDVLIDSKRLTVIQEKDVVCVI
jgi:co-chaperonin GroES (HSP10)